MDTVTVKDLEVENTKKVVEKETGVKLTDREAYDLKNGLKEKNEGSNRKN